MEDNTIEEKWAYVYGFADYQISNRGNIRTANWETVPVIYKEQAIYAKLTLDDGPKYYNLAYIVANAFIQDKPENFMRPGFGKLIHIDGNNFNNHADNLRWQNVSQS